MHQPIILHCPGAQPAPLLPPLLPILLRPCPPTPVSCPLTRPPSSQPHPSKQVRERVSRGRPDLRRRVLLGMGINNSKLCGCVLIDIV